MARPDSVKLRRQLMRLANKAATSTGHKANTALKQMAKKAGLDVESGGKHDNVTDPTTGRSITRIPHSPHAKPTIEAIARAIIDSLSDSEKSE